MQRAIHLATNTAMYNVYIAYKYNAVMYIQMRISTKIFRSSVDNFCSEYLSICFFYIVGEC